MEETINQDIPEKSFNQIHFQLCNKSKYWWTEPLSTFSTTFLVRVCNLTTLNQAGLSNGHIDSNNDQLNFDEGEEIS